MNLRPDECKHCGSRRFIPIITGGLGPRMRQLQALGLAHYWGTISFDAIPLWQCAECEYAVDDDAFMWRNGDTPQEREYSRHVQDLFRTFKPLDEATLNVHRGRRLIGGFVAGYFKEPIRELRIEKVPEGLYLRRLDHEGNVRQDEIKDFATEFYERICAYLDSLGPERRTTITVRMERKDRHFIVVDRRAQATQDILVYEAGPAESERIP